MKYSKLIAFAALALAALACDGNMAALERQINETGQDFAEDFTEAQGILEDMDETAQAIPVNPEDFVPEDGDSGESAGGGANACDLFSSGEALAILGDIQYDFNSPQNCSYTNEDGRDASLVLIFMGPAADTNWTLLKSNSQSEGTYEAVEVDWGSAFWETEDSLIIGSVDGYFIQTHAGYHQLTPNVKEIALLIANNAVERLRQQQP